MWRRLADGADGVVEPLARHEPRDAEHDLASTGRSNAAPRLGALGGGERAEPFDVDPGRHDRGRQRPTGGALGLGRRVRAGGDHVAGVAQHVGQRLLGAGQAAGHGDLGAVQHDVVRQLERRPDQAERHGRVEHHQLGAEPPGELVHPPHHDRVRQQHRLAARARRRNGWAASNSAAPAYGLVSTANRSGGSRRHHSHSSDWMPPILGGKSFVTRRCFMRALPGARRPSRRARAGSDRRRRR